MERFELAGEVLLEFANDVHQVFVKQSEKYQEIANIMATPQYARAIKDPAKKSRSNLNDKLLQDKKIRNVWGQNWAEVAEPCMLVIFLLGMANIVQI